MDDNVPKENLSKLPTNCLSVFGLFVILAIKGLKLLRYLYMSNDHINRYLKRKCEEEPGTSLRIRRTFDFREHCIICGEYWNVFKDKELPDRWKKNKGFRCRTADWGKGNLFFKEIVLYVNDNDKAYKITSERKSVLLKVQ